MKLSPLAVEPGSSRPPGRVSWVDQAKGIGIFLVVFAHDVRGLVSGGLMGWTPLARFADDWIYLFHMPLFFLLGGIFLPRSASKSWGAFVSDKLRTIAYPYLVWSVLTIMVKAVLGRYANHARGFSDLPRIVYEPVEQFWFLYVLFLLVMAVGLLWKGRIGPRGLVGLAILAYPGVLPVPVLGWVPLAASREFAIFLALGVALGAGGAARWLGGVRGTWLVVVVLAGLSATAVAAWRGAVDHNLAWPALAMAGISAVVALSILLDRSGRFGVVETLGRYSLEIFVAHTIASAATRIVLSKLARVGDPTTHLILGTLAGVLGPIALAVACRRVGFRFAFIIPRRDRPGSATAVSLG